MHIPDGYLSPATSAAFYAVMAPVWYFASRRSEKSLKLRQLPLLAFGAAFSFVIMMFSIPIPGGSTGHMTGGAVVAIALGPWAGVVAMSITLALQAFLFGDGGILALGANCFNMAFLVSVVGYYSYRVLAAGAPGPGRRFLAAAVAAYLALNASALAAAVELGLQPIIAAGPDGRPLYAPYGLGISVPAMAIPHLLFFGVIEAAGTALVVTYVFRMDRALLHDQGRGSLKPLWVALAVMAALAPLGLIASGTPWGEWSPDELREALGYVPEGMERHWGGWRGLIPDYGSEAGGGRGVLLYVASAFIGGALVALAAYAWGRLWRK